MLTIRSGLRIAEVFWPTFVERDGVILLASARPVKEPPGDHRSLGDYERFHNHVHIHEWFRWTVRTVDDSELQLERPDASDPEHVAAWTLAKRIAEMWSAKLEHDFPSYFFRVYASRLDDPIVHFHRVRQDERPWIADSDASADIAADRLRILRVGDRALGAAR